MTPEGERQQIHAQILRRRPAVEGRIHLGPSGALVVAVGAGQCVEIGRMRRRGKARWVVVSPAADRVQVREAGTIDAIIRAAVAAIDSASARAPARPSGVRHRLLPSQT